MMSSAPGTWASCWLGISPLPHRKRCIPRRPSSPGPENTIKMAFCCATLRSETNETVLRCLECLSLTSSLKENWKPGTTHQCPWPTISNIISLCDVCFLCREILNVRSQHCSSKLLSFTCRRYSDTTWVRWIKAVGYVYITQSNQEMCTNEEMPAGIRSLFDSGPRIGGMQTTGLASWKRNTMEVWSLTSWWVPCGYFHFVLNTLIAYCIWYLN